MATFPRSPGRESYGFVEVEPFFAGACVPAPPLVGVVEFVVVVAPAPEPLDALTGAPRAAIRHPPEVFTSSTGLSDGAKTSVQIVFVSWWAIATPNCCTFARTC